MFFLRAVLFVLFVIEAHVNARLPLKKRRGSYVLRRTDDAILTR
jgi:hypothetical protein